MQAILNRLPAHAHNPESLHAGPCAQMPAVMPEFGDVPQRRNGLNFSDGLRLYQQRTNKKASPPCSWKLSAWQGRGKQKTKMPTYDRKNREIDPKTGAQVNPRKNIAAYIIALLVVLTLMSFGVLYLADRLGGYLATHFAYAQVQAHLE